MPHHVTRRSFIQTAAIAGALTLNTPGQVDAQTSTPNPDATDPSLIRSAEEGDLYLIGRRKERVVIKVGKQTHGTETVSLLTAEIEPGDAIPVHIHSNEEEFIFLHSGKGRFTLGDTQYDVAAGSYLLVPRGTWHGLHNTGDQTILMVFGYTPAGFEDYFRAIGDQPGNDPKNLTPQQWKDIDAQYGIVYK